MRPRFVAYGDTRVITGNVNSVIVTDNNVIEATDSRPHPTTYVCHYSNGVELCDNENTKSYQPLNTTKMIDRTDMINRADAMAKRTFGAQASARWSADNLNVIEMHTGLTSIDATAVRSIDSSANNRCWVTIDATGHIVLCRET